MVLGWGQERGLLLGLDPTALFGHLSPSVLDTCLSPMGIQKLAHNQPGEKLAEVIPWRKTGLLEDSGLEREVTGKSDLLKRGSQEDELHPLVQSTCSRLKV